MTSVTTASVYECHKDSVKYWGISQCLESGHREYVWSRTLNCADLVVLISVQDDELIPRLVAEINDPLSVTTVIHVMMVIKVTVLMLIFCWLHDIVINCTRFSYSVSYASFMNMLYENEYRYM